MKHSDSIHFKEGRKSDLLDVVRGLETVDSGSPICAQAPHLIGCHDRLGSVRQPVTDEREEEMSSPAKLERLAVLVHVADTANEGGLRRIEALRSLDCDRTRGVPQCA